MDKKVLIINNAEKGISEFFDPIVQILKDACIFCEVAEYKEIPPINDLEYGGIIMTGSPCGDDIVDHHMPYFQWVRECRIPILGICAGHHIIGKMYGAELLRSVEIEIGDCYITFDRPEDPIFKDCEHKLLVRQNHKDSITLPPGFILLAHSEVCQVEAMKHPTRPIYTTQFHPEFLNTDMILNFCGLSLNMKRVIALAST